MTRKIVETIICDRCKVEFVRTHDTTTISSLSYMILKGRGGQHAI